MSLRAVILFGGKKRAGKDFVSSRLSYLIAQNGYTCEKYSIASSLKNIVATTLRMSLEQLEEYKNDRIYYRKILQEAGDKIKEEFGDDCFVKALHNRYVNSGALDPDFILVSDWRYQIEYDYFINYFNTNVFKVFISRDMTSIYPDTHRSENDLSSENAHITFFNNEADFNKPKIIRN